MARNEGFAYREQLGPEADGLSVLDYLSRRYRHSRATTWKRRIEAGQVRLDGARVGPDDPLDRGRLLVWHRPAWDEPVVLGAVTVLYEDRDLVAVSKPAGLPTLPGGGFLRSTLLHRVRTRFPEASPLHRLGRWTSGIVLCARNAGASADLSRQWAERNVHKRYRALAAGAPTRDELVVTAPIGPVPHPLLGSVHAASPSGRASTSRVVVRERRRDEFLCDVDIETGRPHQIRIHLAAAGHPLVGDPLYGPGGLPLPGSTSLPGDAGYRLHAMQLIFSHPKTRRTIRVDCPPPPELRFGGVS